MIKILGIGVLSFGLLTNTTLAGDDPGMTFADRGVDKTGKLQSAPERDEAGVRSSGDSLTGPPAYSSVGQVTDSLASIGDLLGSNYLAEERDRKD